MRQQHNMIIPPPGRGSNRKRKRDEADVGDGTGSVGGQLDLEISRGGVSNDNVADNGSGAGSHRLNSETADDEIPENVMALMDPQTGLILGRPPSMVKYIIAKAKLQFVENEQRVLQLEYTRLKQEEKLLRTKKEAVLEDVLKAHFEYVRSALKSS